MRVLAGSSSSTRRERERERTSERENDRRSDAWTDCFHTATVTPCALKHLQVLGATAEWRNPVTANNLQPPTNQPADARKSEGVQSSPSHVNSRRGTILSNQKIVRERKRREEER